MIDPKSKYEYGLSRPGGNALYRLLKATGREKDSLPMPGSGGYTPDFILTDGQSNQTLRTYCEHYDYDVLGNLNFVKHDDTCGSGATTHWKRNYQYNTNTPNNYLLSTYTGSTPLGTAEYTYDAHGNMLEMPHLIALNWDFAIQLKSSEKTDETTHYVYSGGERVRKVVLDTSGATDKIKYERIYLGGYELYREYDSSENLDLHCFLK